MSVGAGATTKVVTTDTIVSRDDTNWAYTRRELVTFKKVLTETVTRGQDRGIGGVSSLQKSSLECVAWNIDEVTLEGLECLPSHILQQLWDILNAR